MFKLLTLNKISPVGMSVFNPENYTYSADMQEPDGILVHSAPLHDMKFAPNLRAIIRIGAGVNTIPVDRCSEEGIVVFNTPGGNANAVKELAVSAIIAADRNMRAAAEWVEGLKGNSEPGKTVEKGKEVFRGQEIMGKKVGIIGVGAIGSRMAKALTALGMQVIGYDPYLTPQTVDELRPYIAMVEDPREIYKTCDYITVHVPLNDETRDYIGEHEIAMMKDGVRIINFARGPIVNNEAIVEALKSGKVHHLITDFPTDEQLELKNVYPTPHLGAGTPEADENCAVMASRQMIDYLENGNITNSVNLPDVSMRRGSGERVCVIHKNVPSMIANITGVFSAAGVNIQSLINRSRGDLAYSMVDIEGQVSPEAEEALGKLDSVIRVLVYR